MLQGCSYLWHLPPSQPQARTLAQSLRLPHPLAQVLCQRGIDSEPAARRFLQPALSDLHEPTLMPGLETAAQRIVHALRHNQTIALYGDYDVDGITAIAILYHVLKTARPDCRLLRYIPHRIDEGYGLNCQAIEQLADHGAQLIISLDCGITAVEPAQTARHRGVDLIITDHHALPDGPLPHAAALVHPRLHLADPSAPAYPFGELCGAGVAYKLAWQIARQWCGSPRVSQVFRHLLVDLLALAALGTVADVVPLLDENRAIVHFGLGRIKHTGFDGLNALLDVSGLRDEKVDAYHCGFVLGPRLNACGRMGHARQACRLLTSATGSQALQIARLLNSENEKRRATELDIVQQACQQVAQRGYDSPHVRAIVLAEPHWHPGVIGIVASRLVDRYHRPTVLFHIARPDNGGPAQASGSARSVAGFDLVQALRHCAEYLDSFGGHAMAAGMKCPADNIEPFRQALLDYANRHLTDQQMQPRLELDGRLPLEQVTLALAEQLERLAPFGRANPRPRFLVPDVEIDQPPRPLGRQGRHLSFIVRAGRQRLRCVGWHMGPLLPRLTPGQRLDLAAEPTINTWAGRKNVELELADLRWQDQPTSTTPTCPNNPHP